MTYPTTTSLPGDESHPDAKEKATAAAGAAQEQATAVAGTAKEQAANVAGTAKEQVATVAGAATDQARNLLGEAQSELTSQAAAQKGKAVSGLRDLSIDLASMAENSENGGVASHLVSEAARRSGTFADYLDEREPGHLLDDLRDLGRRRTGGFLLGAAVLGFAGGRLLKGSRSDAGSGAAPAPDAQAPAARPDDQLVERFGSLAGTPSLISPDDV